MLLLPLSGLIEKLAYKLVPDSKTPDKVVLLDERLLATPAIAIERCRALATEMSAFSVEALKKSLGCVMNYDAEIAKEVRELEEKSDEYEDILGSYLVKLSTNRTSDAASAEATMLLKVIGDIERISDHAVNLVESAEELNSKKIVFSDFAMNELKVMCSAVDEIVTHSHNAFRDSNSAIASCVEPLEQIIDRMKEYLRTNHIIRLQQGGCTIEAGFVWSDLLSNLERTADHCSNIAGCVIDVAEQHMNIHMSLRSIRSDSPIFKERYAEYADKYLSVL